MRKHTPGPWHIEVHNKHTTIEARFFTITNDVSNNDAHLISAAPEMLEALKACEKMLHAMGIAAKINCEPWTRETELIQVRQAIAKAEGNSK